MTRPPPPDYFGLTGALLDGKFRVERVVAEGGFAVVYRATHVVLERPVALKVLKAPADVTERARAAFLEAFVREARMIAKIAHAHIVQVLDFGVAAMPTGVQAPWMALEWLEGRTLRDELAERRAHPRGRRPAEVLAMLRPVLEALAYAHQAGIAHRDLKPANLMLVPSRRGPLLKLLDFGIAKVMQEGEADDPGSGETRTQSAFTAYSLHYAAPEQLGGMRTGPWTDVHAMALIATELLTDQAPLGGGDRTEICSRVLSPARPTPAQFGVDVGAWEEVLATALNLRGAERFNNAGALLAALEATVDRAVPAEHADATSAPGAHTGLLASASASHRDAPAHPAREVPSAPAPPAVSAGVTGFVAGADAAAVPREAINAHTTLRGAVTTTDTHEQRAGARARWVVSVLVAVAMAGTLGALLLLRAPDGGAAAPALAGAPGGTRPDASAHATVAAIGATAALGLTGANPATVDAGALARPNASAANTDGARAARAGRAATPPTPPTSPTATTAGARPSARRAAGARAPRGDEAVEVY